MARRRVLFIGGIGVISSACSPVAVQHPARQVTDAGLDAVIGKLAAAWSQP
jgi:hypothetical protein